MSKSYSTRPPVRSKPDDDAGPLTPDPTPAPAAKSGKPGKPSKPSKPYPEFPLFPHATRRWAKKIRGRMHYFGPWDDPDGALAKYLDQKDALHAGKEPRPAADALTVKELANAFLNHKQSLVDSRELSPLTFGKYKQVADLVVSQFGKQRIVSDVGPDDFARLRNKMAKRWGPLRVRDFIQHIRSVFKHGFDTGMIPTPMRFGPGFARPSKKTMRLERAKRGIRMFEAAEIRRILDAAGQPLKAMILLGVNAGYGNQDCGTLPMSALDLETGWVTYHRPKTGIDRRCPLWPETVAALREALAGRPNPKNPADAGLVFITRYGLPWAKDTENSVVSKEMRKVLDTLGINGHRNFYGLRRTFETIGGETKDQVAVDAIMGHADESMAGVYRQRIGDDRLQAVANHVRTWLFAPA
jgi:integrase